MTPDVEEPVDETADTTRMGDRPPGMGIEYRLLTPTDRHALRIERAHGIEADLYRIELALEEPIDNAQREHLANRAELLLQRLRVHLTVLSSAIPDVPGP